MRALSRRLDLGGSVLAVPGERAPSLFELLARPSWMADAACKEHPDLSWFVGKGVSVRRQRAVCQQCLVRDECLDYALDGRDQYGMWGGLTLPERRRLRADVA